MTESFFKNANEKSFRDFREQYGRNNFIILKEKVENNLHSQQMSRQCDIVNIPKAEQLLEVIMKIDYINVTTYCEDFTASELEKKNDYMYYSAIILLNYWTENYLPQLLKNSSNDRMTMVMKESVWMRLSDVCKKLGEIYDELEKNYR
jgi:hypothetical protein